MRPDMKPPKLTDRYAFKYLADYEEACEQFNEMPESFRYEWLVSHNMPKADREAKVIVKAGVVKRLVHESFVDWLVAGRPGTIKRKG